MIERSHPAIAPRLRSLTPARVGLDRTGVSQHTRDVLQFQRAHAMARDAVHTALDAHALAASFAASFSAIEHASEMLCLHSAARDRQTYLQRPDLGRALDERSRQLLEAHPRQEYDLALIVADGLSALAVERHANPLLQSLFPQLDEWTLAPICIVEQGRVAIGDEIGEALCARIALVLIGERPGLSSPDSLGAYITWMPRPGRTDAERVCISNIRADGLDYAAAAAQLHSVLVRARRNQLTGVAPRAGPLTLGEAGQS